MSPIPVSHRGRVVRPRQVVGALVAGAGLAMALLGAGTPAVAGPLPGAHTAPHPIVVQAPGDPISVSTPGALPDFGSLKQGTTTSRTIDILNDGVDNVLIDPAPLSALMAPFTLQATTLSATVPIAPGQRRSVTVAYTAPAAGTVSMQGINLPVVDADRPGLIVFPLVFKATSLATDPAHFEAVTADGASAVDFHSIAVGTTASVQLNLKVQGIHPLAFSEGGLTVKDNAGGVLPVRVTGSSFGTAGKTYRPGETATLALTFAPTVVGTVNGTLTIDAQVVGVPDVQTIQVVVPITGNAAVTPTPSPTPTPTPTPTTPPTPVPTTPAAQPVPGTGTGGSPGGSASTGSTLAHTGASPALGLGLAGVTLVLGAIGSMITTIAHRRIRRRS